MIINAGTYVNEAVELAVEPAPTPEENLEKRQPSRLEKLVNDAAEAFGVPVADVLTHKRTKSRAAARNVVMWAVRTTWPIKPSYPEVGAMLGGYDHTTVITATKRIEAEIAKGSEIGRIALRITAPATVIRLVAGSGAVFEGE